ncbi:MAG: hypothetical protein AAGB18_07770, partial [Pseudomonadota bacterium]
MDELWQLACRCVTRRYSGAVPRRDAVAGHLVGVGALLAVQRSRIPSLGDKIVLSPSMQPPSMQP